VAGKTRLRGSENATGEVAVYSMRNAQGQPGERLEEVLLATPRERLIVRLAPRNEASTFAFADFRLRTAGTGSHLDMTLYWTDRAHGAAGSPELQKTRDEWVAATQTKMQGDLARLKAAAEAVAAAPAPGGG
jgi:hypothetical protein